MSNMLDVVLASLDLRSSGEQSFEVPKVQDDLGRQVVFGGEVLGQAIVAASRTHPTKRVKSVQTIFARGMHTGSPIDIRVETMHEGRNLGSATVTFSQDGRLCARGLVLLDVGERDLVRHQPSMPPVDPPDESAATVHRLAAPETIIVDEVDIDDPAAIGEPELRLWVRFAGAPTADTAIARAVLSYATDGWLIATAMRPHDGIGQSMAHKQISTGVVSHALSFHADPDPTDWHLIDHRSVFAGGGRCYGSANVFSSAGELVASFTQEALLRHFPEGQDPRGKEHSIF
jgi:acyl-CoA thioesterase-2